MKPEFKLKVFEMDDVLRTPELLKTVRRLTICSTSGMNHALDRYEIEMNSRKIEAKAIIAYQYFPYVETFGVGWALYARDPVTDVYRFKPEKDSICFQIFVDKLYRRRGIGSRLMRKAVELAGENKLKVYEWDAPEFFETHQVKASNIEPINGLMLE